MSILLIAAGYVFYAITRPISIKTPKIALTTTISPKEMTSRSLGISRSAIGYIDPESNNIQCRNVGDADQANRQVATASLAKTITVQVVLDKHPLKSNESGPIITLGQADVDRYSQAVREGGSRIQVVAGEQLTERQMIEGIMMRSANNLADSLAIWAFGSHENYRTAATEWLKEHGLSHTTIGSDASGFIPDTTSTPADLCKIILLATKDAALSQILSTTEMDFPVAGHIKSTNRLLGQYGVFAGKTGYNEEAGRGVILAAHTAYNDATVTTAAVSLSQPSYNAAFDTAAKLLQAIPHDIQTYHINQREVAGLLNTEWGQSSGLMVSRDVTVPYFIDQPPHITTSITSNISDSVTSGAVVGNLSINGQLVNVVTNNNISSPRLSWRLTHPF